MDELLQEFIAETRETLAAIASEIVAWEADPADRARLDAIFRFVHTVKGSCGFLDLPRLARLSHEAENALAAVRDGRRQPNARLVDAVLAIIDRIGELTLALETGVDVEEHGDAALIAALDENAEAPVPTESVAAVEPCAAAAPATARVANRSVRLSVDLLDRVMSGMSDMVLARNELARRLREGDADPAAQASLERLSLTVADLRETISRTRMQAIDALFAALPRMVRDAASQLGKQVQLTVEGSDVEIDREMIEAMRDPLMHIVRNAIDHGIEPADARAAAGKPAAGRLIVRAHQSGNTIVIEVCDDGAGIDTARLVAKHAASHGRDPIEYARLNDRARAELIFAPGLSSRDQVNEISGRGVGMDVVRTNVEQIGGRIELRNDPGRGLAIVIHVPLTLSILPTVVVSAAGQSFAIARQSVGEILAVDSATVRIHALGDDRVATIRGERMALVDLSRTLGVPGSDASAWLLAIIGIAGGTYAMAIDQVVDMQELVVKPAAPPIMSCGLYAGQTLPDTGVPMLVLDAAGIASANRICFSRDTMPAVEPEHAAQVDGVEVLVFDDLDHVRRAIPLTAVERIDEVAAARVTRIGGRLRLCEAGQIVDVVARAPVPDHGEVAVVRLRCAGGELAMAIDTAVEIVTLPSDWADGDAAAGVLGVALYDGAAIEIVDPCSRFTLVEAVADGEARARARVCVLAGEAQGWMAQFLAPTLERAGYQVAVEPPADDRTVAVLAMEGEDVPIPAGGALIPLADAPDGAGVYRYDRAAVLAAVKRAVR